MEEENKKKNRPIIVKILDVLLSTASLVFSFFLLFYIPWTNEGLGAILMIGSGIFFFIGYFRLFEYVPVPEGPPEIWIYRGCFIALAVFLQLFAFSFVYVNPGTQGCLTTFLFLIESLSICVTLPDFETFHRRKSAAIFCWIAILILIGTGVYLNVCRKMTMGSLMAAAYMLVDCIAIFQLTRGRKI